MYMVELSRVNVHFLLLLLLLLFLLLLSFLSYIVNIVCCRLQVSGCMCELSRVNVHYLLLLFFLLETPGNTLKLLLLFSILYCISNASFPKTSDYVPLLFSSLLLLILLLMRMRMRMRMR